MRRISSSAAAMALAFLAAGGAAQENAAQQDPAAEQPPAAEAPASPAATCIVDPPGTQQAQASAAGQASTGQAQQLEKPSVAKDVGSAAGGTAGQIAGAAVGGPIGAAAVGVVGERVGRAIGSVVKGDKKKRQRKEAEQAAANVPPAKCIPETPARQPGA